MIGEWGGRRKRWEGGRENGEEKRGEGRRGEERRGEGRGIEIWRTCRERRNWRRRLR